MPHILLFDDNEELRRSLALGLATFGFTVSEAADREHALKACSGGNVDLIIAEVVMPGVEGIATILALMKGFPRIPIIAMSGATLASEYLALAMKLGADQTIVKPFTMNELVAVIRQVLPNPDA